MRNIKKRSDSSNNSNMFELNLIDTPGHSDFSYEVSRALRAVEGAILLVDATQGIQAQTLANLESAKKAGLKVIGALNKVDMSPPGVDELALELSELLGVSPEEIHRISAKNGDGVEELLNAVVKEFPEPEIKFFDDHSTIFFGRISNINNLETRFPFIFYLVISEFFCILDITA